MKIKKVSESYTTSTHIVLPNNTNTLNNLMGGTLLHWLDATAAICAQRHAERIVVTAGVNHVSFNKPIKLGNFITLQAKVSRAFTSSIEIYIDVIVDDFATGKKIKYNNAIYTFVAIDQNGKTIEVPKIKPETEEEKQRYDSALRRKQLSLILAGKMNPNDATELKAIFKNKKYNVNN